MKRLTLIMMVYSAFSFKILCTTFKQLKLIGFELTILLAVAGLQCFTERRTFVVFSFDFNPFLTAPANFDH